MMLLKVWADLKPEKKKGKLESSQPCQSRAQPASALAMCGLHVKVRTPRIAPVLSSQWHASDSTSCWPLSVGHAHALPLHPRSEASSGVAEQAGPATSTSRRACRVLTMLCKAATADRAGKSHCASWTQLEDSSAGDVIGGQLQIPSSVPLVGAYPFCTGCSCQQLRIPGALYENDTCTSSDSSYTLIGTQE
eukprot:3774864-Rhodomonas_salina.1